MIGKPPSIKIADNVAGLEQQNCECLACAIKKAIIPEPVQVLEETRPPVQQAIFNGVTFNGCTFHISSI